MSTSYGRESSSTQIQAVYPDMRNKGLLVDEELTGLLVVQLDLVRVR